MNFTWPPDPDSVDSALRQAVSLWNGLGLPLLLIVYVFRLVRADPKTWADRRETVRVVGSIHYGLALWSVTAVASALWLSRGMGAVAAQVLISEVAPAIPVVFNVPIGFGLRRLKRWTWVMAIIVGTVRVVFSGWLLSVAWRFGGSWDPAEWPMIFSGRVLPVVVLAVLLWPGTWRALSVKNVEEAAAPGRIDFAQAMAARVTLIVVTSVVLTDVIDALVRAVTGST